MTYHPDDEPHPKPEEARRAGERQIMWVGVAFFAFLIGLGVFIYAGADWLRGTQPPETTGEARPGSMGDPKARPQDHTSSPILDRPTAPRR